MASNTRRIEVDINIKTYGREWVNAELSPESSKDERLLGEDKRNGLTIGEAIIKLAHYLTLNEQ